MRWTLDSEVRLVFSHAVQTSASGMNVVHREGNGRGRTHTFVLRATGKQCLAVESRRRRQLDYVFESKQADLEADPSLELLADDAELLALLHDPNAAKKEQQAQQQAAQVAFEEESLAFLQRGNLFRGGHLVDDLRDAVPSGKPGLHS